MASTKELRTLIKLAGKIDPSLQSALMKTQAQTAKTSQGFSKLQKTAAKAAGLVAGYFTAAAAKRFGDESVEAAKKQIEAETKLEAVLKNVRSVQQQGPLAYREAKKELMGVASQLQNIGVIGDEVTLAGFQQLATFQMSQKEISILSSGMTDLLAQQKGLNATQQDSVNIANMMGKVMDGQVGALSRIGISFTKAQEHALKTGDRMQRAATLAEVLQSNVGGVNKALAQTDQGKIQNVTNRYGDMQEVIGAKLLPLQAKFAEWFVTKIPVIEKYLVAGIDKFEKLGNTINWVRENSYWLIPALTGVAGGFAAFHIISTASKLMKAYTLITKTQTIAQWALNTAMNANPFLRVALYIGALIAVGVALWKNWDKVQKKAKELSDAVKKFFAPLKGIIGTGNNNIQISEANAMQAFKYGGVADRPSIFGDGDTAEAAIPLKRTPRSLNLLDYTSRALGVKTAGGINLVYSPVIQGGADRAEVESALALSFEQFKAWAEQYFESKERVSLA